MVGGGYLAKPTAQTYPNQTKLRFSDAVKSLLFNRNLSSPTNGEASNTESKSSSNSNNTIKLDSTIWNVFLTAVHSDLQDKERRRRNVIISGVQANSNDKLYVENFFSNELGLQPDIITTRRIGCSFQGWLQPICVTLRDANQASNILEYAHDQRKPNDPYIRGSVFVNEDLTPAKARAAYDRRQILRQQRSASQNKNTSTLLEPRQSGSINVNNTFKPNVINDLVPTLNMSLVVLAQSITVSASSIAAYTSSSMMSTALSAPPVTASALNTSADSFYSIINTTSQDDIRMSS